ncbi:hypothetical protein AMTR_s00035p00083210 [Amborella trichopoda]|uniref:Uncharacterized protein n=1 Tax=Amborella trichopoda TaxID=13333 RepID=W1PPS2_AMBTC|nr:hypothetical protein AMTR_s00035p00083210 [Amborella trichopoda]
MVAKKECEECFRGQLIHEVSKVPVKQLLLRDIIDIPHVKLVALIYFANEILVGITQETIVELNDCFLFAGTEVADFNGGILDAGFAVLAHDIATAEG